MPIAVYRSDIKKYYNIVPDTLLINCDFNSPPTNGENSATFCGYTQETMNDFNWVVQSDTNSNGNSRIV